MSKGLFDHVRNCDAEGCYCPDDVVWGRLLGDDDPAAPGKDVQAAAFGTLGDDEDEEHFPWNYTEFGVLCACGDAMDRNERCLSLIDPTRVDPARETGRNDG